MAKVIGLSIAIVVALSGTAVAGSVEPEGVGTGTVATATPTGVMGGTVATATPTEVPTATVAPTNTEVPPTPTFFALIDEGGCGVVPPGSAHASFWLVMAACALAVMRRTSAQRPEDRRQQPRNRDV